MLLGVPVEIKCQHPPQMVGGKKLSSKFVSEDPLNLSRRFVQPGNADNLE